MATHSSIEPGGLQIMGLQKVRQDRAHTHTHTHTQRYRPWDCKESDRTEHTYTHTHRGRICNSTFSKVNAPRKEKSGAYSQKETCLKFNRAEWNVKAALVRSCREEGKTHGNDIRISRL